MILFTAAHTGLLSIVSDVIPAGIPYTVEGSAHGETWLVAEGVGSGATVQVSDPAAPFDGEITYTVTAGSVDSVMTEREFEGELWHDTFICSADGRAGVSALWEGDAARSSSPGVSYAQPLNRRRPVQYRPLVPGGPSWAIDFRVALDDVETARRALDAGLVWVVHSRDRCEGGSTLPRVMLAGIDGEVAESRGGSEGRSYSLALRQLDHGVTGVPVVTWGEARAAGVVWGPDTTFASIRTTIGGV